MSLRKMRKLKLEKCGFAGPSFMRRSVSSERNYVAGWELKWDRSLESWQYRLRLMNRFRSVGLKWHDEWRSIKKATAASLIFGEDIKILFVFVFINELVMARRNRVLRLGEVWGENGEKFHCERLDLANWSRVASLAWAHQIRVGICRLMRREKFFELRLRVQKWSEAMSDGNEDSGGCQWHSPLATSYTYQFSW